MNDVIKILEECLICRIPRKVYDLTIEPGYSNPDFTMGDCCLGHIWVQKRKG